MRKPSTLVRLALLVFTAVVVGVVSAQSSTVLRVASTAAVTTWDPSLSFSTEAFYMANLYEPLIWANAAGSDEQFTPALATSWELSDDGLSWTFHLRDGVKFHDGETMDADAVVRSIERHKAIGGAAFIWEPVDKIVAVDDLTVRFDLKYPTPLDLVVASSNGAWIVSPAALDAAEEDDSYFEAGIAAGTGPYMLAEYQPDAEVVLRAFPDYWGGWDDVEHFENVVIRIVSDAVLQEQMLLAGEVDLALSLPVTSYQSILDNPAYNVQTVVTPYSYLGFLNTLRAPLDDVRVRQAIAYAVPYLDLIAVGAEGFASQARGPVPQGIFPWSEEIPQYHQDLEKARALLAEAGHEGGGFTLHLTYSAENAIERAFAPVLADGLAEIGIKVEIEPLLWNQQWAVAKDDPENAQDIFLVLYWPTISDAGSDNLWTMFHSSDAPYFNLSYWKNDKFDDLVDEAIKLTGTDRDAAQALYLDAMDILYDEAPGLFFFDYGGWFAIPTYLAGYEYNVNYPFATFFYPLHLAN